MRAFHHLPIVQKLLIPLVLMGLLTLGTSLYALSQMRTVGDDYQGLLRGESEASLAIARANEAAGAIGRLSYMMVAEPDSFIIESFKDEIDLKAETFAGLLVEVERRFPALKKDIDGARADFQAMLALSEKARLTILDGRTDQGGRILVDEFDIKLTDTLDRLMIVTRDIDRSLAEGEIRAEARFQRALWVTLAVGLLGMALVMALSFWLSRAGISGPLKRIVEIMTRLADGELGVTPGGQDRRDEIGGICRAVAVFRNNMQEAERLRGAQEAMKARAEQEKREAMARLADEFAASMEGVVRQLAESAERMRRAAQGLNSVADQTNRQTSTVAQEAEQAAENVNTVAAAAEELSASIQEISRRVAESSRIAGDAVLEAERSNATVQGLVEAAARIGDVVNLINAIAGQTNLLALNATIEAARAGEAGKGFAVVANEVKQLATQTARATEEIGSQITRMQAAAGTAAQAIQGVGGTIGRISEIVTTIAAAVEQQGAATSEIAHSVAQAASGTSTVSATIGDVTRAAAETGSLAEDVLGAANGLVAESNNLHGHVEAFVARVRAA